jgi:hypothetical protein
MYRAERLGEEEKKRQKTKGRRVIEIQKIYKRIWTTRQRFELWLPKETANQLVAGLEIMLEGVTID